MILLAAFLGALGIWLLVSFIVTFAVPMFLHLCFKITNEHFDQQYAAWLLQMPFSLYSILMLSSLASGAYIGVYCWRALQ